MGTWIARLLLVAAGVACGVSLRPVTLAPLDLSGALGGLLAAAAALLLERALRAAPTAALLGGLFGLLGAGATAGVASAFVPPEGIGPLPRPVVRLGLFLLCGYAGLALGAARGKGFTFSGLRAAWTDGGRRQNTKVLDTSVIIDGRIADVSETGFLDGTLVVPQFVLRELQYIADSTDTLKRNRGRKGLDILQRIKKHSGITVQISETDFPEIRDVDMKLIELARQLGGKIITNDFNLNKVAELRGVPVLNINVLANALKPVVLPGESMSVFILKEGKEPNQGVGYLDDGTMVVVDNAKRHIGRNIQITVTSVLQTTAGKMFFGRTENHEESGATPIADRPRRTGP